MALSEERIGLILSVLILVAGIGLGLLISRSLAPGYISLACVDGFTGKIFQTNRAASKVEVTDQAFIVYGNNGDITLMPRTDNLICTLSEDYADAGQAPR